MRTTELSGLTFTCLEGCGYCCTFPPEVSGREQGRLRLSLKPKPLKLTLAEDGRTHLALQNKCGACTLLERRACTSYEQRPAHCRYFPFHLHFAEEPEVYVNRTCRGVETAAGGNLAAAFQTSVLANVRPDDLQRHEQEAREAYGTFKRKALRAEAWNDVEEVIADVLSAGPALFTRAGVDVLAERANLDDDADSLHAVGLEPFGERDVTKRPFYLAPDLRWLTFERDGEAALRVLEMDERGTLTQTGRIENVGAWEDPAPFIVEALVNYLARLTQRRLFVGNVYAIVDNDNYESTVEDATHERFSELVVELTLRARILAAMGTPADHMAEEVERFYDSTFLDSETIGGFL